MPSFLRKRQKDSICMLKFRTWASGISFAFSHLADTVQSNLQVQYKANKMIQCIIQSSYFFTLTLGNRRDFPLGLF